MGYSVNSREELKMSDGSNLFYRDGREFTGIPSRTPKNAPVIYRQTKCSRCGGAGGSDAWKFTGWTCFQCAGSGKGPIVMDKLYTREKLDKLVAASAKREAAKQAKHAEKQAQLEADRAQRRAQFLVDNADLFARAEALNDEFVNTMILECVARVAISARQIELINNKIAEKARKQAGEFVSTVGSRVDFTCTLVKFFDWSTPGPYGRTYSKYGHIMRDENGNAIKYVGSKILGGVKWEGRYDERHPVVDETAVLKFKATVTEHADYKGEKQTVVARPTLPKVEEEVLP